MKYAAFIAVFLCAGLLALNHGHIDLLAIMLGASLGIFAAWKGICHILDGLLDRNDEFVGSLSPRIDFKAGRDGE